MKVFIINLERSLDRKEHMQRQIQKLFEKNSRLENKLEFIFFKAVDAKYKEHLEFKQHFPWWASWVLGRELSDGEKACFASHYKLWQECVKIDEPIIILEDDVEFSDEFLNHGEEYIEELSKSEYEYVRFCYLTQGKMLKLNDNFLFTLDSIGGTQGYFIKPISAFKFIDNLKFWIKPVDNVMDMYYYSKVFTVIYIPLLLKITDINSTIEERERQKKSIFKRIIKEICRLYFIYLKFIYKHKVIKFLKK